LGDHTNVIPAKAGIQAFQGLLDSRLRGNDGMAEEAVLPLVHTACPHNFKSEEVLVGFQFNFDGLR